MALQRVLGVLVIPRVQLFYTGRSFALWFLLSGAFSILSSLFCVPAAWANSNRPAFDPLLPQNTGVRSNRSSSSSGTAGNSNQSSVSWGSSPAVTATSESSIKELTSTTKKPRAFGMSYFVFFDGPGVTKDTVSYTPNWLARPSDDGIKTFNLVSLKWRFSQNLALDFQTRTEFLFTNGVGRSEFTYARWQSPRIGISGTLARGAYWNLSGAINTDFPYMFPAPLGGGFIATQRTVLLNPGFFATLTYKKPDSPWSFYSLVTPRYFFYKDRSAAEPQLMASGMSAGTKPEIVLQFSPSLDYSITPKLGARLGTQIDYRKLIASGWNPFNASLSSTDVNSKAWRLWPVPLRAGPTYDFSELLQVFAFAQTFPFAEQRTRSNGSRASLLASTSLGLWISGSIL